MIKQTINQLVMGNNLRKEQAGALMDAIMGGEVSESQIASVLIALRMKGETFEEIAGFARAMRQRAVRVCIKNPNVIDTCGTGGDGAKTFNISTATAILAAAMGIPVAKHGNRAISSKCGSADVLESLGVNITLKPEAAARLIRNIGVGFLFAPHLHPAMKHAAPVRKQLGVRTIFNVLGPLTNPADVKRQVIGVFEPGLTETLCRALKTLGAKKAYVVYGEDGVDEISICGETRISALERGKVRSFTISPEDAGLKKAKPGDIQGGSPEENARIIEDIFKGKKGPCRDVVLINAGFAAMVADKASNPREGVQLGREALDSKKALTLLCKLKEMSQEVPV